MGAHATLLVLSCAGLYVSVSLDIAEYTRAAPSKNMSSGICGQRRPRSACASAQADQGLHCLLTESLDTTKCMNGEQQPR